MAEIKDVLAYFLKHYPHKKELTVERLELMLYLADWKSCIEHRKQIMDIQWVCGNLGPRGKIKEKQDDN